MLKIEKLVCLKPKYHKDCVWENMKVQYPDTQYLLVKDRLARDTARTGTAYRISHQKFGILTTIKKGHDGFIFISDNDQTLRDFALYAGG